MAKFKAPNVVAAINVVPMADIMLVMLIIFMVITPMLSKGVSVDLVKTKNPIAMSDADKDDAVLVAVTREGKVFLGTTPVAAEQLAPKVKDMLANRLDKMCYVKSDSRAKFERVVEVVENLRAAQVDQIGLLTESVDKKLEGEGAGIP